jgi:Mycotoxin biosynthesis protein UstYa
MNIEPTKHYRLSGHDAGAEWAALAPNNGIIHLRPQRRPYSISLFHQLRCLDIIRRDIVGSLPPEGSKTSRHCLNYMRQMVLCRADLAVDPVLGREFKADVRAETNQCVDWRRVYQELEKNQQQYVQGSVHRGTSEQVSRMHKFYAH